MHLSADTVMKTSSKLKLIGEKMIDYEITVDVSNVDIETKKRVQDAYFKLGFVWSGSGSKYNCLDKDCYTNASWYNKKLLGLLMWTCLPREPTHTVDELLELAGMKTKADLKPFDLERALAGDPVVTRRGVEVIQLTLFKTNNIYKLAGVVDGELLRFTPSGEYIANDFHELDLFMKVKTHKVNGFEVPVPVTNPENMKSGVLYYVADNTDLDWYFETTWENDEEDKAWITRNLVFMSKEDAITTPKAMSGVNPYGGCNE